jgi:cell division protein FtsQ
MAAKRRAERARAAVLPFPWRHEHRPRTESLLPSRRSLALGLAAAVLGVVLYAAARYTPAFAIETIDVHGASVSDARHVRETLEPLRGASLVGLHAEAVMARLASLPEVASARYDRAFPHTLRVVIVPERPVAILRQRGDAWSVSGRGRVIRRLDRPAASGLPRIWLAPTVELARGTLLDPDEGGLATHVLAVARATRFPYAVRAVRTPQGELTLVLRSGLELELGSAREQALKLAVARRVLPVLPVRSRYLDVSVPERPVSGQTLNSKVEVEGCCAPTSSSSR